MCTCTQLGGGALIETFMEKPDAKQQESMSMSVEDITDFYKECSMDEAPFEGVGVGLGLGLGLDVGVDASVSVRV
jgi:hypothetical protein